MGYALITEYTYNIIWPTLFSVKCHSGTPVTFNRMICYPLDNPSSGRTLPENGLGLLWVKVGRPSQAKEMWISPKCSFYPLQWYGGQGFSWRKMPCPMSILSYNLTRINYLVLYYDSWNWFLVWYWNNLSDLIHNWFDLTNLNGFQVWRHHNALSARQLCGDLRCISCIIAETGLLYMASSKVKNLPKKWISWNILPHI